MAEEVPLSQWLAENPDAIRDRTAEARDRSVLPEDFRLEVVEAPLDQSTWQRTSDGTVQEPGLSLRRLREIFGGDHGSLTHPFTGEPVPVSLEPWAGRNPDTTIIRIGFTNRGRS